MIGRRLHDPWKVSDLQPGDYARAGDGTWWICLPGNGERGTLREHQITEHEDGTITVNPSILFDPTPFAFGWHGHLVRGMWTEA